MKNEKDLRKLANESKTRGEQDYWNGRERTTKMDNERLDRANNVADRQRENKGYSSNSNEYSYGPGILETIAGKILSFFITAIVVIGLSSIAFNYAMYWASQIWNMIISFLGHVLITILTYSLAAIVVLLILGVIYGVLNRNK